MRCLTGRLAFTPADSCLTLPAHLVPSPFSTSIRKPLAASLAEEHETLPCPKPRALLWSRPPALRVNIVVWQTLLVLPGHAFKIAFPLVLRVRRYLAPAFSIPRHALLRCLCRDALIYATVCEGKIRFADSTRNLIPALKTDSSQRQLQANVTAAASAHGG